MNSSIRSVILAALSYCIANSACVDLNAKCETTKANIRMNITDHTETPFRPNVASSDDSTFEGRMHSFIINGNPEQLSEIRSSTGELLYFGIPSEFYAHHNGEVFGFSTWLELELGVLPSLHKEHKTGPAGRPHDPILCGSWDEFVEKVEKVEYFFPTTHFFPNSLNSVRFPIAYEEVRHPLSNLINLTITSVRFVDGHLVVEHFFHAGGDRRWEARTEMEMQGGPPFQIVRAWIDGAPVDLERDRLKAEQREQRSREQREQQEAARKGKSGG